MALDQRPMNVAEMIEELRARHGRIAPAGDHHLQHVLAPLVSCAFLFEHDLLKHRHPFCGIVLEEESGGGGALFPSPRGGGRGGGSEATGGGGAAARV